MLGLRFKGYHIAGGAVHWTFSAGGESGQTVEINLGGGDVFVAHEVFEFMDGHSAHEHLCGE